jgi:hypothetical protein
VDLGHETAHRFFCMTFQGIDPDGDEVDLERYGSVLNIYVTRIFGEEFTLIKAKWFKAESSHVDLKIENVKIRLDLAVDPTKDSWTSIRDLLVSGRQVVVSPLDYAPGLAVVLDRRFDTLILPEDD